MKAYFVIGSILFLWLGSHARGAFEVTPLDTAESRSNAAAFWSANGCSPFGVLAMARAAEHYYAQPAPAPFVAKRYASAKDFFDSLTRHPAQCGHAYELSCFDFVSALLENRFQADLRPDDSAAIFLAPYNTTETDSYYATRPTPRLAFTTSYYDWYRELVTAITGRPHSDRQISVMASLYSCSLYPWTDRSEPALAREALHGRWQGQRFALPETPAVVLQHEVWKKVGVLCTIHAGILFRRPGGYTYFEKCGGRGPFLRFDGEDEKDITGYYRRLVSLDPFTNKWSFISIGTNAFEALAPPAVPRTIAGSDARAGARAPKSEFKKRGANFFVRITGVNRILLTNPENPGNPGQEHPRR